MSLMPLRRPSEEDRFEFYWRPPEHEITKGWWTECMCDCHRHSNCVHVMACCDGGWKLTFAGIIGRAEKRDKMVEQKAQREERAGLYRPAHGGYPDGEG